MFCTNCGKKIAEGSKFCTGCGKTVPASGGAVQEKNKSHYFRFFRKLNLGRHSHQLMRERRT